MYDVLPTSGGQPLPGGYYEFEGVSGGHGLGDIFGVSTGFGQPSTQADGGFAFIPEAHIYTSYVSVFGGNVCNTIDVTSHGTNNAGAVRLYLRDWPKGTYDVAVEIISHLGSSASSGGGSFVIKDATGAKILEGRIGAGGGIRTVGSLRLIRVSVASDHGDALVLTYESVLAHSVGATGQSQIYTIFRVHWVRNVGRR